MIKKELKIRILTDELAKIIVHIDIDKKKAKQMLTNLKHNLINEKGKCFKISKIKEI